MNPDRFAHIMQQLVEIGLVPKPVPLTRFSIRPLRSSGSSGALVLLEPGVGSIILLLAPYLPRQQQATLPGGGPAQAAGAGDTAVGQARSSPDCPIA